MVNVNIKHMKISYKNKLEQWHILGNHTPLTPKLNHGMLRSCIEEVMGISSRVALTSEFGDITSEELVNA